MTAHEDLFNEIKAGYPKLEKDREQVEPYLTLNIPAKDVASFFALLKERLGFDYLDMVTAVDWKGPVNRLGYITEPNPNPFLPDGATPQVQQSPATPNVAYRESFEVVYLASALSRGCKVMVKAEVPRNSPNLPSLAGLYKTADWQEREVYDLLGVTFDGHPNLKKILTPDFIQGHPLRKDYVHQKDRYDD